ncbi:MAG: hypothetical protein GY940_19045 [bacterium]|nr:hypothetical protein [bacterium]
MAPQPSLHGKATDTQKQGIKEIEGKVIPLFKQAMDIVRTDVPEMNRLLGEHNIPYIALPETRVE